MEKPPPGSVRGSGPQRPGLRPFHLYGVLLPFAAGMLLRLWRLPRQILAGDELHAVRTAIHNPVETLLTTWFGADPSIPLTLLYRLWLDAGGRLTEMGLRLPVLATSVLFLFLAPVLLARVLGRPAAGVFAWLAAASPALVLYGRIVRSYLPVACFGFLAAALFWGWWERVRGGGPDGERQGRAWPWGLGWVLCAAFTLWLHLGAGPFLVAPFAFAAGELLLRSGLWRTGSRGSGRSWAALVLLGLGFAAACLAFLLPGWGSFLVLVEGKSSRQPVPWPVAREALELATGGGDRIWELAWVAGFWLAALAGLGRMLRRGAGPRIRRLGLYGLALAGGHALGLWWLAPMGRAAPVILFRYHLIALPVVLAWIAVALVGVCGGGAEPAQGRSPPWRPPAWAGLGAALALGSVLVGPLAGFQFLHGNFAHHVDSMAWSRPAPKLVEGVVPEIYHRLADREPSDGGGPVLEYPWHWVWSWGRAFPLYQEIHRRQVLVSVPMPLFFDERVAFDRVVGPDREAFLASRARWLLLHLKPLGEEDRLVLPPGARRAWPCPEAERHRVHTAAKRMAGWLERGWGPPHHAGSRIVAWDLEAVRAARSAEGRAEAETDPGAGPQEWSGAPAGSASSRPAGSSRGKR